eukprot:574011_1
MSQKNILLIFDSWELMMVTSLLLLCYFIVHLCHSLNTTLIFSTIPLDIANQCAEYLTHYELGQFAETCRGVHRSVQPQLPTRLLDCAKIQICKMQNIIMDRSCRMFNDSRMPMYQYLGLLNQWDIAKQNFDLNLWLIGIIPTHHLLKLNYWFPTDKATTVLVHDFIQSIHDDIHNVNDSNLTLIMSQLDFIKQQLIATFSGEFPKKYPITYRALMQLKEIKSDRYSMLNQILKFHTNIWRQIANIGESVVLLYERHDVDLEANDCQEVKAFFTGFQRIWDNLLLSMYYRLQVILIGNNRILRYSDNPWMDMFFEYLRFQGITDDDEPGADRMINHIRRKIRENYHLMNDIGEFVEYVEHFIKTHASDKEEYVRSLQTFGEDVAASLHINTIKEGLNDLLNALDDVYRPRIRNGDEYVMGKYMYKRIKWAAENVEYICSTYLENSNFQTTVRIASLLLHLSECLNLVTSLKDVEHFGNVSGIAYSVTLDTRFYVMYNILNGTWF